MEWREVQGYEGLYEVCDLGYVRSVDRMTTGNRKRMISGKVLKDAVNSTGYCVVDLCKDGKVKMHRVHRLVADAFLPADKERPYINHKDGKPWNNQVRNLERCTQKENVQHAYDTGLRKPKNGKFEELPYLRSE